MKNTKTLLKKWKELSIKAASFQGRIILTLVFFTFISLFGLIFSYKKKREKRKSYWQVKDPSDFKDLSVLHRQ